MPKLKTHKATSKRIRITKSRKNKKLMIRKIGQDHFNANKPGKNTRMKRRDIQISESVKKNQRNIKRLIPYN